MKTFILAVLIASCALGASSAAFAQNLEFAWVGGMSGARHGSGSSIAMDASGHVYTTGSFGGTVDFDPGIGIFDLTRAGQGTTFVQKLDASGNLVWAKAMDGWDDRGYSVAVDASGNVYTTGSFNGTTDFDPGAGVFSLTSVGGYDIFVQKLDALGNFLWVRHFSDQNSFAQATKSNCITVDASGNVYITGRFYGTVDFDPGAGTVNLTSPAGRYNAFVQKMDTDGNLVWAKQTGASEGSGIAVDASGNVYSTGSFGGTVDFDPGAGTFNLSGGGTWVGPASFVQKLDTDGNFVWAAGMSGTGSSVSGRRIAVDVSGNVYTTGGFYRTVDFDPGAGVFNLTSVGYTSVFVQKLDTDGNFLWAAGMGGTSRNNSEGIAVDASGNVYTTGYFNGITDFDPGTGVFSLTGLGGYDNFVQKLDASGNFVWAGSMRSPRLSISSGIAVDASGNVYTTGNFSDTVDFDPGPGIFNLTPSGHSDFFVSKLSPAPLGELELESAARMGGTGNDQGHATAVDASGNVYTTGSFEGTVDFDPGVGIFNLTSAGSRDIFVTKLDADHNFLWAIATGTAGWDEGYGIAVDAAGDVYNAGSVGDAAMVQKLDTDGIVLWSETVGGGIGTAIAVDASGHAYTTGYFSGTVDFDPGSGVSNLISAGDNDIFVQKLDTNGNFVWAENLGGSSSHDEGYGIAVDASGFVYATGLLDWDVFVQKLDSDGTLIWNRQMGGGSYDTGRGIAVDASGHVYTTGRFSGTADFDPGAGTYELTSSGSARVFVSTLDAAGNFVWAKQLGDTSADSYEYGIALDAAGNVYTTGSFIGTADFDPGSGVVNLSSAGQSDIFVSQLDPSGDFIWAGQMGGAGDDEGHGIALSSGVVYTTGHFESTADFDPGAGTFNLASAGNRDIFVSKLSRGATAPVVTVDVLVTNDTTPELTGTIDNASAVIHVTVSGSWPTQTHPAINNGATWTLADNTLSAIWPGVREVTVTAWDLSGNASTDATNNELTILGTVAGPVTSNLLTPGQVVSGARLELTAPSGTNYQWKMNGVNLTDSAPRVTGTTSQILVIDPLEASDSGAYTVEYQATSTTSTTKQSGGLLETDPFDVEVDLFDFPEDSFSTALPAATVPVVTVLGVLLALTGAWGVRRRRTAG